MAKSSIKCKESSYGMEVVDVSLCALGRAGLSQYTSPNGGFSDRDCAEIALSGSSKLKASNASSMCHLFFVGRGCCTGSYETHFMMRVTSSNIMVVLWFQLSFNQEH